MTQEELIQYYNQQNQMAPQVKEEDPMADLFEVPQSTDNDMYIDDLLGNTEEESIDDLVDVDLQRDIMGGDGIADLTTVNRNDILVGRRASKPRPIIRPQVPPASLGGIR